MIPTAAQMGFYQAAAEVLPVFLLVLVVGEARLRDPGDEDEPFDALLTFALLIVCIVAAEVASLRALLLGHDSELIEDVVAAGLGLTIALFTGRVLGRVMEHWSDGYSEDALGRRRSVILGITLLLAIAIYAALIA